MTSAAVAVSPLRRGEVALAAAVLAAALHDDPGWRHVVPDPGRRKTALRGITGVAVRDALAFGGVLAARDDGRLQGVAVWLPPGRYPMSGRRKVRTLPATAALAMQVPRNIFDLARFGASIDAVFPSEPVWYLQILGVHPHAQRHGLGLQLLQPVLARPTAPVSPATWKQHSRATAPTTSASGSRNSDQPHRCTPAAHP